MINNFELIQKNLTFNNERSFYFIQILKRKKENPEMKSDSIVIDNFYIFSVDQLTKVMPHIITKCEENKARAYIKMNCLDAQSVMLEMISVLSHNIREEKWKEFRSALNSACGKCGKQNGTEKLYLVDLDNIKVDSDECNDIIRCINNLEPLGNDSKVKIIVPTKNGCHLLTTGFNIQKFKVEYNNIDIHDDGITLLYFPESCS